MGGKLPLVRAENERRLSGGTGNGRYGWKVVGSGQLLGKGWLVSAADAAQRDEADSERRR